MKHILLISVITILASCHSGQTLEDVLKLAEDNRFELEKVLSHYSTDPADSLKLRAARYLIENMASHISLTDEMTDGFFAKVDQDYPDISLAKKIALFSLVQYYTESREKALKDIKNITSDFLIRHIDKTFVLSGKYLLSGDMPFEIFCKFLLPYRIACEPLDYLVDKVEGLVYQEPDELIHFNLGYREIRNFFNISYDRENFETIYNFMLPPPVNGVVTSDFLLTAMHAKKKNDLLGIPSAIFFTPHHHDRNGRHYWNHIIYNPIDIQHGAKAAGSDNAKVYMMTYESAHMPIDCWDNFVPNIFLFYNLQDVTKYASQTVDIELNLKDYKENSIQYVYLSVFNQMEWRPVAFSEYNNERTTFEDMGTDVLYQTVYYDGVEMHPLSYPFYLTKDGEINFFKPNKADLRQIRLKRKYPFTGVKANRVLSTQNILLIGSMNEDLSVADTLPPFKYNPDEPFYEINIENPIRFKYLRFIDTSSRRNYNSLAEIVFYNSNREECLLPVKNTKIQNLFDKNLLLPFYFNGEFCIEFETAVSPVSIRVFPHTDENDIYPNDVYELFYADKTGWQSLGVKVAENYYIEFDKVPDGALLWLHNHTKGQEERPFIFKDRKMMFF